MNENYPVYLCLTCKLSWIRLILVIINSYKRKFPIIKVVHKYWIYPYHAGLGNTACCIKTCEQAVTLENLKILWDFWQIFLCYSLFPCFGVLNKYLDPIKGLSLS